jgi:hypothetical protein
MLPPPENRTRGESGYPLRPIIEMTPGIAESFFKRLTLLQAETPAVTTLNGLRKPHAAGDCASVIKLRGARCIAEDARTSKAHATAVPRRPCPPCVGVGPGARKSMRFG